MSSMKTPTQLGPTVDGPAKSDKPAKGWLKHAETQTK